MARSTSRRRVATGRSWTLRVGGRSDGITAARLWRAMNADQLVLYCQPTVDCVTGQICAAEALVRWHHPRRGLIAPGEWVPAIERSRLRNMFNLRVLSLAAAHHDAWAKQGLRIPMSINITPAVLADQRCIAGIEEIFAGRSPRGLRLEITERTTTINSPVLKANVERLTRIGFSFLLDDFGVGYSSLQRIANLPVATLKIDASLSRDLCENATHRAIVRSVSQLARALDLDVICEGVEDEATWRVIQSLGPQQIQGYYVARPMPAEALPDFVGRYQPDPPRPQPGPATNRWSRERRAGTDQGGAATASGSAIAP